jgi:hypothetical protein
MVTHVQYVRSSELVERWTVCNLTEETSFFLCIWCFAKKKWLDVFSKGYYNIIFHSYNSKGAGVAQSVQGLTID